MWNGSLDTGNESGWQQDKFLILLQNVEKDCMVSVKIKLFDASQSVQTLEAVELVKSNFVFEELELPTLYSNSCMHSTKFVEPERHQLFLPSIINCVFALI